MIGHLMFKGRTIKQVLVSGVDPNVDLADDRRVLDVALTTAREDRSSLFGWDLVRVDDDPTRVIVTLHTD